MSTTDMIDDAETIAPEELRDAARRLLADKADRRAGWNGGEAPAGEALVAEMAGLGWLLLTVPAARGGLGQSFAALAPIYEELGRTLSPVMIAPTMAAIDVLALDRSEAGADLLDRIAAGEARVIITFADATGDTVDLALTTVAGAAQGTDLLLLPQAGEGAVALVDLAGAIVTPVEVWDRTRAFGDIRLEGAPVRWLDVAGGTAAETARAHLSLATAWDCIGAAQQALDEAVAYMGTRRQFDRPIGSFQALKHRAADHKVAIEIARSLARFASDAYVARSEARSDLAGQARLLAVDAFNGVAEDAIQFHGGIGFTWEQDCHLFLKRALMNGMLDETPEQVRDRVAPGIIQRALHRR